MSKMTSTGSELCERLLRDIDTVFPPVSQSSARLTDAQSAEIKRLRREIRRLCEEGRDEEAERAARLAVTIIREGPPGEQ